MEIDLREIQALHARYARETVVIDLEGLVRALPAPRLLTQQPAERLKPLRRLWNGRSRIARHGLMMVAAACVCASLGMGAARLRAAVHGGRSGSEHTSAGA